MREETSITLNMVVSRSTPFKIVVTHHVVTEEDKGSLFDHLLRAGELLLLTGLQVIQAPAGEGLGEGRSPGGAQDPGPPLGGVVVQQE